MSTHGDPQHPVYFVHVAPDGTIELMQPAASESEWLAGAADRAAVLAQLDRRIVARHRRQCDRRRTCPN